jgi:hypothetical protein
LKRINFIFVFLFSAYASFAQQIEPSKVFNIYFQEDFEDNTLGTYSEGEWREDWNYPPWANRQVPPEIVASTDPDNPSQVMRFIFPEGSLGASEGGGQWYSPLGNIYEELYFSFRLKFKPGFEPVLSGKLPGLMGEPEWVGVTPPGWSDGFSAKFAWTNHPDIINYIYHQDQTGEYGDSYRLYYDLEFGKWFTLTMRIAMNTVGQDGGYNNGILETYINGRLYNQIDNLRFRNLTDIGIDNLFIVSCFGGATDEFRAIRDEWIEFDDFIAFTYKPEVDVPHGNEPSAPDRVLLLPHEAYNDSVWRRSLSASAISNKTVGLEWKNYFYPVDYTIQRRTESETNYQDIVTLDYSYTSYINRDLLANTTYYYRIKNENSVSDPVAVTTPPPVAPQAPTSLVSLFIEKYAVKIGWNDNSTNESGFIIERSDITSDNFTQIATVNPNVTEFLNSTLTPNTNYYYRVKAFNEDGQSGYSDILSIRTQQLQPPANPTNLSADNVTTNSCSISWSDNSDNETGFYIERSTGSSEHFIRIDTLKANTNVYTDHNVQSNTSYYYRLAAFNADGVSVYSDMLFVLTDQIIYHIPPSNLQMISISPLSVEISWNDNSTNETGFQIQRADTSMTFTDLADVLSDITQYRDSLLNENSTYSYRIRSYNNDGYSDFSDTLTVHTPENIVPPVPSDFKIVLVEYDKVILSWDPDTTQISSGYEIIRATDTSGYVLIQRTGIDTTYTDTAIQQGTDYFYRIRGFNSYNYSPYSLYVQASIPILELPEPPELLPPADIESDAISIQWIDKSTDESGFVIKRALYPTADFKELFTSKPNDTLFVDKTVMPNTTYYYMVNAVNKNGQSKNSNKVRVSSLSLAEAARYSEGLIAYYNFSLNSNTIIHDLSKHNDPVDLLITDTMCVNWTKNSRFEISGNTVIRSEYPASKIIDACKKTNEITLECWIKPNITDFNSDATIISLSRDPENIGFSLMQSDYSFSEDKNYRYLLGLSTKSTESSGRPFLSSGENDFVTLYHIAYTKNRQGEEKLFLNGEMVANSIKPLGLDNWSNDYHLYLGNESTLEKPWTGMFYLMAIYNVALTTEQVSQNYKAGPTDNLSSADNVYDIKLFPNPAHGRININISPTQSCDYGEKVILQLIDLNGFTHIQEIIYDSNKNYHKEFDVSHLQKGIYYFRLISSTASSTKKITLF